MSNTEPFFASRFLPWLERGGVIALAGVRGGGEYGEEWHLGGKEQTKPNTWKDFIACAEYLIAEKYSSAEHLAGQGGSAGGILIGNSIVERPDLFAAAIDNVGVNNALRAETTSNGVPNIPEFG
jgi:prolyl oligopeptidase